MKPAVSETVQKYIQAARPTIELLESINPKALILRVKCLECSSTFTHDVAFVLKMTRKTGFFIPSSLCPDCRVARRKSAAKKKDNTNPTVTKKSTKKKAKPAAKKLQPVETKVEEVAEVTAPTKPVVEKEVKPSSTKTKERVMLTHRPFEALKDFKTEKQAPVLGQEK